MPKAKNFAELLNQHLPENATIRGKIVTGEVVALTNDFVKIDVGLKSEGRVAINEFTDMNGDVTVQLGDKVEVLVERIEDRHGEAVLSRDKARRDESWDEIVAKHKKNERVQGRITGRVKGGFAVNISGVVAFLPGSQVDIRPTRDKDIELLMQKPQSFSVVKIDEERDNIVISRRAILEEDYSEKLSAIQKTLKEGAVLEGKVKNLTDYGAFIELGGLIDGLLHVGEMSWRRINHPSDFLSIGQMVKVKVINVDKTNNRVSLSMKALEDNPWLAVAEKYPKGQKVMGKVTNITDYGAFVSLEAGVEGLAHISEFSWTKKGLSPAKILSVGQDLEVMVLDIDHTKRRLSLGVKQCMPNPWEEFANKYKKGDKLKGTIKNTTEFGIFVGLNQDLDGMVHSSDISWEKTGADAVALYQKGQEIEVILLDKVDLARERIALGIKQLTKNPMKEKISQLKKDQVVTATVIMIQENGIEVDVNGLHGFIARANLAKDKADQRSDRFAVGERVDAQITAIDKKTGKLTLSIKSLEQKEEKEMIATYGSQDSGARLADIFKQAETSNQKKKNKSEQAEPTAEEAEIDAPMESEAETAEANEAEPTHKDNGEK